MFLASYVTLVYCGKAKKQILADHDQEVIDGYEFAYADHDTPALGLIESNTHYVEAAPVIAVAASHRSSHLQPGYSVGGPLASIAKGQLRFFYIDLHR